MLKPLPSPLMKPILVFVNPKSGGNQVRKHFHLPLTSVRRSQTTCNVRCCHSVLNLCFCGHYSKQYFCGFLSCLLICFIMMMTDAFMLSNELIEFTLK